jgi:hypothetical protein
MKVAIIFIGTGKYLNFLPSWYESCEEYLLPNVEKKYIIFSDGEISDAPDNAVVIPQEHLDWPYITLYRFKMIKKSFEEIRDCDWLLFLDADMRVVDTVTPEELFDETKKYIGVHHPCDYLEMPPHNQSPGAFEINQLSNAGIVEGDDLSIYYQGCVWGGKIPEIFDMITELDRRIDEDYDKKIIATWHDESHLNKFYAERSDEVNIISPSFAYPEVFSDHCTFEPKIVHLAKDNSKYHV